MNALIGTNNDKTSHDQVATLNAVVAALREFGNKIFLADIDWNSFGRCEVKIPKECFDDCFGLHSPGVRKLLMPRGVYQYKKNHGRFDFVCVM